MKDSVWAWPMPIIWIKLFMLLQISFPSPPPLFIHSLISPSQSIYPPTHTNALFHVLSYFPLFLPPSLPHPDVSWTFCRPSTFLGVMWSPPISPQGGPLLSFEQQTRAEWCCGWEGRWRDNKEEEWKYDKGSAEQPLSPFSDHRHRYEC